MLSLTAKQGEVLWPHNTQGSLLCQEPTLWSPSRCLNHTEWSKRGRVAGRDGTLDSLGGFQTLP